MAEVKVTEWQLTAPFYGDTARLHLVIDVPKVDRVWDFRASLKLEEVISAHIENRAEPRWRRVLDALRGQG